MTDSSEQQKAAIRKNCVNLRRLVAAVKPDSFQTILQEVRRIESDALKASLNELPAVKEKLERLINRLKDTDAGDGEKIITAARWKQFFGSR